MVYSTLFGRPLLLEGGRLWLTTSDRPAPATFPDAAAARDAIDDTIAAIRADPALEPFPAARAHWSDPAAYSLEDPRRRGRSKA